MRTRSWVTPNRTPQAGAPRCGLSSLFSLLFTSLTRLEIHRHQFLNTRESEAAPRTSCRIRTPRPLRRCAEPVRPEPRVVPEARTRPAGPRRGGPRSPEAGSPGTAGTEWSSAGGSQGTRVLLHTPCARSLPVSPSPEGRTAPHSPRAAGHARPASRACFCPRGSSRPLRHARPPATPSDTGPVSIVSIGAGEASHSHLPASPGATKSENT